MAADAPPPTDPPAVTESPFRSVNSLGLPELLERNGICLLVSTYQAGKLMAVRGRQGRISTLLRSFERPMGLAVRDSGQFALGTRGQVWFFRNCPDIAVQLKPPGSHDACFLPRHCSVTGDIHGHDLAWTGDDLWIVNTRFSCLCTLHPDYSFVPRWRPPFVSALAADDRCHLNGLAVVDGRPRYVTALGEADSAEGWRPAKADGGIVIDVASGAIMARGMSMPHSPRFHAGRLWVLDSGTGQLQTIDLQTGQRQTVAEMPGFTRGLAFHGPYAFVGLSRIRESALFAGLPVSARHQQLSCGIWVIDLRSGQTAEFMQFEAGVEEIFAVEVLSGIHYPEILGFKEETIHGTFVVPEGVTR
jgi:uncharacterized protein (TIGR03032 family)